MESNGSTDSYNRFNSSKADSSARRRSGGLFFFLTPCRRDGAKDLNADISQQTVCYYSSRWFWVELLADWLNGAGAAAAAAASALPRWWLVLVLVLVHKK